MSSGEHTNSLHYCKIVHTSVCHPGLYTSLSASPRSEHSSGHEMPGGPTTNLCLSRSIHIIVCLHIPRMINFLCDHKSGHYLDCVFPEWHTLGCVTSMVFTPQAVPSKKLHAPGSVTTRVLIPSLQLQKFPPGGGPRSSHTQSVSPGSLTTGVSIFQSV